MSSLSTGFYAYPSRPASLTEVLEGAVKEINDSTLIKVTSWRDLNVTGKPVIEEILAAIDKSRLFLCDLTYLNFNVLFELGYAIGSEKRLWISLDTSVTDSQDYGRLNLTLVSLGYAQYSNQHTLIRQFYTDRPWEDDWDSTINLNHAIPEKRSKGGTLFYLKSKIETQSSIALSEAIANSPVVPHVLLDDPGEVPDQPLSWYVQNIHRSDAVIVHLLANNHTGSRYENARSALVAGLALALNREVLLLAHDPFTVPFDFHTYLRVHATASECRSAAASWLESIAADIAAKHAGHAGSHRAHVAAEQLRDLDIGDVIAENEEDYIEQYFVETSAYLQCLRGNSSLFVGRKGTGKTANLYAVSQKLARNPGNLVCVVKPVGYELEGVLDVLRQQMNSAERGYLIESLWKALLYAEVAQVAANELRGKPPYYEHSDAEAAFLAFMEEHQEKLAQPFAFRLARLVESLNNIGESNRGETQRLRVSEALHANLIRDLRYHLGEVLCGRGRVAVLLDNLDKAWGSREGLREMAALIVGLVDVVDDIQRDFRRSDHWRRSVNLTIALFLRSDIFAIVQDQVHEVDKLTYERIRWAEHDLLFRVLDERLGAAFEQAVTAEDVWTEYFAATVAGEPVRDFIARHTLAKPRDVIYLMRTAIAEGVNRGHQRVESEDFLKALDKYSQFAFDSIVAEDDPEIGKLEEILYEFAGAPALLERSEVLEAIKSAGVSDDIAPRYLDLLLDIGFIGIETAANRWEFGLEEQERQKKRAVAARVASRRSGREEKYIVNPAFHPVLQIT